MESDPEQDDVFFAEVFVRNGDRRDSVGGESSVGEDSDVERIMSATSAARHHNVDEMSGMPNSGHHFDDHHGGSIFDDDEDDHAAVNRTREPMEVAGGRVGRSDSFSLGAITAEQLQNGAADGGPSSRHFKSPNFAKKRSTAAARAPKDVWWYLSFMLTVPFFLFFVPSYSSPSFHDNNLLGGGPLPAILSVAPTATLFLTAFVIAPLLSKIVYATTDETSLLPSHLIIELAQPSLISKLVLFGLVIVSLVLTPYWGVFAVTPLGALGFFFSFCFVSFRFVSLSFAFTIECSHRPHHHHHHHPLSLSLFLLQFSGG